METRARYATIGFFTLLVIMLAFGFIYWLKRLDETGLRAPIQLEFNGTVSGLAPGGSVYFGGIKVGNVISLKFDDVDPSRILVVAEVRRDTPLKTDTTAQVGANLLTGVAYVELIGGSPAAGSLFEAKPPLLVGSRSNFADVIAAANTTVVRIDNIVERVDDFLSVNQALIEATVGNVRTFTDALAENADDVKDFVKNLSEMSKTVSSLSDRLNGLVDKADTVVGAIDPAKIRSTIDNADQFVKRVTDASDQVQTVVDSVKGVVSDLAKFSESLNTTLDTVKKTVAGLDPDKIRTAVDGVAGFADKLTTAGPDIQAIIADAKSTATSASEFVSNLNGQKDALNQIVADAKQLADRLNQASVKLDQVLGKADTFLAGADGEGTKNLFQEASDAAKAIREAAETIRLRTNEVGGDLSKFSSRGLDSIFQLVNDLRATVARIDRAVADFARNPGGAVLGGGNSGVRDYNRR